MTEAHTDRHLRAREPSVGIPSPVLEAAARAGRRRQPADLRLLERVLDGLRRLPGCSRAGGVLTCRSGSVSAGPALACGGTLNRRSSAGLVGSWPAGRIGAGQVLSDG
jgi:hypothetical protein